MRYKESWRSTKRIAVALPKNVNACAITLARERAQCTGSAGCEDAREVGGAELYRDISFRIFLVGPLIQHFLV